MSCSCVRWWKGTDSPLRVEGIHTNFVPAAGGSLLLGMESAAFTTKRLGFGVFAVALGWHEPDTAEVAMV